MQQVWVASSREPGTSYIFSKGIARRTTDFYIFGSAARQWRLHTRLTIDTSGSHAPFSGRRLLAQKTDAGPRDGGVLGERRHRLLRLRDRSVVLHPKPGRRVQRSNRTDSRLAAVRLGDGRDRNRWLPAVKRRKNSLRSGRYSRRTPSRPRWCIRSIRPVFAGDARTAPFDGCSATERRWLPTFGRRSSSPPRARPDGVVSPRHR